MKASKEPKVAELEVQVNGENEKQIVEGLHDPIATALDVNHDADGTITGSLEFAARGITMSPSKSTPDTDTEAEPPVYGATVNWDTGRVNTDEWDIDVRTAREVYDQLIDKTSRAVKAGEPEVVIVGEPQYRALWVFVDEIHESADNPEQLVPLRMIVVPGPQLHVEQRNLDVLFGADR
jgi:hypothetical protein